MILTVFDISFSAFYCGLIILFLHQAYFLSLHASTEQRQTQQQREAVSGKEDGRDLTEADLKTYLQESSHNPKSTTSISRVASFSVLAALDNKMKKGEYIYEEVLVLYG